MCFSPEVSFTASAVLLVIGIATIRKTNLWQETLLASVPIFFAVQQLIEGILWVFLLRGNHSPAEYWVTQMYAAFVGVIWPVFVPSSIFLIEPNQKRRRLMIPVILTGIGVAIYTLNIIIRFGVHSEIANACILYQHPVEQGNYVLPIYIIATCAAFFCSSHRTILRLGGIYMVSFLAAYYFYRMNYVSVWCFFSACISGVMYLHFNSNYRLSVYPNQREQPIGNII